MDSIASKHLTKDEAKLVQAVAVESGATSKKMEGEVTWWSKDHPTSPISLHAAPSERSGLKKDQGNRQTPCKSREAREVGLHRASPWSNNVSEGHRQSEKGHTDTPRQQRATKNPLK